LKWIALDTYLWRFIEHSKRRSCAINEIVLKRICDVRRGVIEPQPEIPAMEFAGAVSTEGSWKTMR
jgi:hypothetical protein